MGSVQYRLKWNFSSATGHLESLFLKTKISRSMTANVYKLFSALMIYVSWNSNWRFLLLYKRTWRRTSLIMSVANVFCSERVAMLGNGDYRLWILLAGKKALELARGVAQWDTGLSSRMLHSFIRRFLYCNKGVIVWLDVYIKVSWSKIFHLANINFEYCKNCAWWS